MSSNTAGVLNAVISNSESRDLQMFGDLVDGVRLVLVLEQHHLFELGKQWQVWSEMPPCRAGLQINILCRISFKSD